jgi:hypothetical protein
MDDVDLIVARGPSTGGRGECLTPRDPILQIPSAQGLRAEDLEEYVSGLGPDEPIVLELQDRSDGDVELIESVAARYDRSVYARRPTKRPAD